MHFEKELITKLSESEAGLYMILNSIQFLNLNHESKQNADCIVDLNVRKYN